ncbi:CoA transferase [Microbacterium sp. 18062]|uniref:CoA transferase n=1 Tax=Microbacterium sp. 18062 TaxID=2681410 RepID=UPI001358B26F|nr:CoA transferase [Microbacterium sp. 18062]
MGDDPVRAAGPLLARLWRDLGVDPATLPRVEPARRPVPLPSRTDVATLSWGAVSAASLAAASLAGRSAATPDPDRVASAYTGERHALWEGSRPDAFAPLSGFFRCADGWVRTHGNYPHHAAALRRTLGVPVGAGRDEVADALLLRPADAIARDVTAAGGLCVPVAAEDRSEDTRLRASPLVRVTRLGAAAPAPRADATADAPLRGTRILDLTRVIAGPLATQTLALLGAEVLRIDPPSLPELPLQHLVLGHGKRSALLDLTRGEPRARFERLLAGADVMLLGYRPAALDRLGLSAGRIAERRPGIVVAQLSAWGDADRRGFDSLVQARSGLARVESSDGETPGALPAQALDHTAGYLLATAVMTLLARRAAEGGSWLAETSLRRVAAELLGTPRTPSPVPAGGFDPAPHLQSFEVAGSALVTVRPAIAYAGAPSLFASPRPWGGDAAEWAP